MAERRCLNCESTFAAAARFCPQCSQRTDTARLSFVDMTRDLLHAFVNVERGPLVFAWALLTRPGVVAREYIEGRRRRYYGPFATLAVLVQLPLLGFTCALLFRDARLTLPEHMVLVAYTLGMRAVALTAIVPIALLSSTSAPTFWQNFAFWAAWYLYFGWSASQFYAGTRWRSWLRGMLVAAIGHALIIAILV